MEPTKQICDPDVLTGDKLAHCREDPLTYDYVVFKDVGPTWKEGLVLIAEVLDCDTSGTCYKDLVLDKLLPEYQKVPTYKATADSARPGSSCGRR